MVGTVVIKRVFNNNVAMVTSDDGSELIVIGLPLNMDGTEGERAAKSLRVAGGNFSGLAYD